MPAAVRIRTQRRAGLARTLPLAVALGCVATQAGATSIAHRSFEEIVHDADHVIVAKVVKVDMVDAHGRQVRDREARTGPGLRNRLRFHLDVRDVLFTACQRQPRRVLVPLWSAWHYSLGAMQDQVEGSDGIFLLKGPRFEPAYPADFQRDLGERTRIDPLVASLRLQREPASLACREARPPAGA